MLYTNPQGKKFNIPDDYLNKQMQNLGVSKMEAVQLWLEDNGVEKNEELETLDQEAKKTKIQHGAGDKKRTSATRERKPNLEKQNIIAALASILADDNFSDGLTVENIKIVKSEREISFQIKENSYSLTLTCHRKGK